MSRFNDFRRAIEIEVNEPGSVTKSELRAVLAKFPEEVEAIPPTPVPDPAPVPSPAPELTFTRTVDDVVYDLYGAPLRTDGKHVGYGKHEAAIPSNPSFDWTHGAKNGQQSSFPNGVYTHHNAWGQVFPRASGTPERRVRLQVVTDGVWHLVKGVWMQRKTSNFGNLEGGYWDANPVFTNTTKLVSGTHFRSEPSGGYSIDLLPTTNADGTPHATRSCLHTYYSTFWPRVEMVLGTTAVAIQARMRLISDDETVDVSLAEFYGAFSGDFYTASHEAVAPSGINPAFAIPRHKKITKDWKTFGIVTGSESAIRGYPTMPFLV